MSGPDKPNQVMLPMRLGRTMPRVVWWLMMAMPAIFIVVGVVMLLDGLKFASRAERTTGTVISVETITSHDRDSGTSQIYLPTLDYTDADGQTHRGVTHISSGGYDYAPGTRLDILYDPAAPAEVRIDGAFSLWGMPLMFILIGWLFIMVVRFVRRRITPTPPEQGSGTVMRQ